MPRHILLINLAGDERTNSEQIYIDRPACGNIEKLLDRYVADPTTVEFAEIVEIRRTVRSWSNPNCCPES